MAGLQSQFRNLNTKVNQNVDVRQTDRHHSIIALQPGKKINTPDRKFTGHLLNNDFGMKIMTILTYWINLLSYMYIKGEINTKHVKIYIFIFQVLVRI